MTGPVKRRSTYYTAEKVAAARANIARHEWARSIRDHAIAAVGPLLAAGDDWCWSQVTTQGLPRSYAVNQELGSPVTGQEIYRFGNYAWLADPGERPWKLTDPSSGTVFPTNDFWSFYRSGLDERGDFDRRRGDPRFLVNLLYPERGERWGVDDGFGWVDERGDKWTFAAYYNHWFIWHGPSAILSRVTDLARAYLFTGEAGYAHLGLILLDRIADVYPAMDTAPYRREDGYLASDGLSRRGKVVGSIWETNLARGFIAAYDALFPAIAVDDAAGVVPFLAERAVGKSSPAAVRANIENGLLRQIYPAVLTGRIRGNFGMHQAALAMAAVVLDDPAVSPEWIDFLFADGEVVREPEVAVTGGDIERTLVDVVDRDGNGDEASPSYNHLWVSNLRAVADILDGYDGHPSADLYQHPKFRKMFQPRREVVALGRYTLEIGDTGVAGRPFIIGGAADYAAAFARYGLPADAQLAHRLDGDSTDALAADIFSATADETREAIGAAVGRVGPFEPGSVHLTGYGLAVLRDGAGDAARDVWLYHGRNIGHGHKNVLAIGLHGHGVELTPPLGYPEFADGNVRRAEWEANTIASNTVVVDAGPQQPHVVGAPRGFAVTANAQFADVDAAGAYPQTSMYRRAVALIRIDAERSYVVDVFRVVGGAEHCWSFHTAGAEAALSGAELAPQPTGSYAGPQVDQPLDTAAARSDASGFDWLGAVSRSSGPAGPVSVDWAIPDTWGVLDPDPDLRVRLTLLGGAPDLDGPVVDEVALADGVPPRNKTGNPPVLRYLIARRAGSASQFVSVIEPYLDSPQIVRAARVRVVARSGEIAAHEAAAVRIELADGRTQYVISSTRADVPLLVDGGIAFTGLFGFASMRGGELVEATLHGGAELRVGDVGLRGRMGAITGVVGDFTRTLSVDNEIAVAGAGAVDAAALAGAYIYVGASAADAVPDGQSNAVYRIVSASRDGAGRLRLDIGDVTTIIGRRRGGYRYGIAIGEPVRIALTHTWPAP